MQAYRGGRRGRCDGRCARRVYRLYTADVHGRRGRRLQAIDVVDVADVQADVLAVYACLGYEILHP